MTVRTRVDLFSSLLLPTLKFPPSASEELTVIANSSFPDVMSTIPSFTFSDLSPSGVRGSPQ